MRKTITVCLLAVMAIACFAQSPTAGINILQIRKQVVKVPAPASNPGTTEPKLEVEIMNTLATTNSFELDVIFIGIFNPGKNAQRFIRKMLKFPLVLKPLEKQTISADSILWFDSYKEPNAIFPRGASSFSTHEGWIIRAVSEGRILKVVGSDPAMERLAADPYVLSCLEAGQSIPVK